MASFIGAIITTVVAAGAAITAAWISHSAKISEFRQAWINGLRDDLATYFKALEALHFWVGRVLNNSNPEKLDELEQKKQDTRNELLFAYRRILHRLNMKETLHRDLSAKLKEFWMVEQRVPDQAQVDEAIALSQALLKEEWKATQRDFQFPVQWHGFFVAPLHRSRQQISLCRIQEC